MEMALDCNRLCEPNNWPLTVVDNIVMQYRHHQKWGNVSDDVEAFKRHLNS